MTGPATEAVWFQVAEYVRRTRRGSAICRVHAKTFGTTTTACGMLAVSMLREWELPKVGALDEACAECHRILARARGARRHVTSRADAPANWPLPGELRA
ncbi:hypothetical protein ACVW00_003307 [Marmoricola sp. URHA0025 HA25]